MLRWAQPWFEERGVEDARLDAEVLLAHVTGLDRVHLYANFDRPLQADELRDFKGLIKRRVADREPVAYLVGYREFWSLRFAVDKRVLIPRPDTETVVELARHRARELAGVPTRPEPLSSIDPSALEPAEGEEVAEPEPVVPPEPRALRVADIGTGSGIIAVALAKELPFATLVATDLSSAALEVACANVETHGVTDRVSLQQGDMLEPLGDERFDLIVSNPPYIGRREAEGLMPEVVRHEPMMALSSGPSGMELLEVLATRGQDSLVPGGWLVCEIGHDQGAEAAATFERAGGWLDVRVHQDRFSGQDRVLEARRPA